MHYINSWLQRYPSERVERMGKKRNASRVFAGKSEGLENLEADGCVIVKLILMIQDRLIWTGINPAQY